MTSNIGCIVVTYNRLDKLKTTLKTYDNQVLQPDYVIVVDNSSNDGTDIFLKQWKENPSKYERIVVSLKKNMGGSGGFYAGEKLALTKNSEWIMVADDDAYLDVDYIKIIHEYLEKNNTNDISVVCGALLQHNEVFTGHRAIWKSRYSFDFMQNVPKSWYLKSEFEFDFTSYVGPVMNKAKLCDAGLVNPNYFIWHDDSEHSIRLRSLGKFICLPAARIIHDADDEHFDLSWKTYYGYRNKIDLIKKFGLVNYVFIIFVYIGKALLCPLKGKSLKEVKIRLVALRDGIFGNLGLNDTYKPGWKL